MDSLERQMEEARHRVVPVWDYQRANRVLKRIDERRVAQRGRRVVGTTAFAAAAISSLIVWQVQQSEPAATWQHSQSPVTVATASDGSADVKAVANAASKAQAEDQVIPLQDGSSVHTRPGSAVRLIEDSTDQIVLALDAGRAKFEVIPRESRVFKVHVADVEIAVLGTIFDVVRHEDGVEVSVERGLVRVSGPAGDTHVSADSSRRFDYEGHPLDGDKGFEPSAAHTPDRAEAEDPAVRQGRRPRAWRSLAKAGDFEAAYAALHEGSHQLSLEQDPAALLDAADAARLSGHPEEGARYLARITKRHAGSPVAPLAAFTLGRVCLEQLGQPHRAAHAFALAYRLAPSGSLAQDALAREVEALSKGGREHDAYLRAQDYVRRYPQGRRLRAVRLYGNLE